MNKLVFDQFSSYINERLQKRLFTTEDSVRYSFFSALMNKENISPSEVVMEYPHNKIKRANVDTYIPQYAGGEAVLEFKYHREIPSKYNSPCPQQAGQLFNDIYRLREFNSIRKCLRLLIYLTDNEMVAYMSNPSNNLREFFELNINETLVIGNSFFSNKSKTFIDAAHGSFNTKIKNVWKKTLLLNHELRIFEIN